MCTRYYLSSSVPRLEEIILAAKESSLTKRFTIIGSPLKTEGEVRPTDVVPVLAPNPDGEETVYPMRWGYTNPYKGGKILLNARTETAHVKPMFKEDWINHRCIIPALYYFEWSHYKKYDGSTRVGDRYIIQPKGESITWLCGLYHIEDNFPTFVVLTKEPTEEISGIHDRMPFILPSTLASEWIKIGADPEELIKEAVTEVIAEKG